MTREQFEEMWIKQLTDYETHLEILSQCMYEAVDEGDYEDLMQERSRYRRLYKKLQSLTYEDWQADQMIADNQDLLDDLVKKGD